MYEPNSNAHIDAFLAVVRRRPTPWAEAFGRLHVLAMFDLLPAIQILKCRDAALFTSLGAQLNAGDRRTLERLLWAYQVVATNVLPPAVGDLVATGQVADAQRFLAARTAAEQSEGRLGLLSRVSCGHPNDMQIIRNAVTGATTTLGSDEVHLHPDILMLIFNVASTYGTVRVLSLYRRNHGFHGKTRDGIVWAEAVDISAAGDRNVNLIIREGQTLSESQKSSTLDAVVRVINVLHAPNDPSGADTRWFWRIGLPRAGVPFADLRSDEDIFYQVAAEGDMYRTRPLTQLQDYTRTQVSTAMSTAATRAGRPSVSQLIVSHFADSPDHIHISVSRQGDR